MSDICLVHGYLLRGTGSNIYVSSLARTLCSIGHDVSVVCQEPHPELLDYVTEAWSFRGSEPVQLFHRETGLPGKCTVFQPDIEQLLVYVHDEYFGFRSVKTMQEATSEELETFIDRNVEALRIVLLQEKPRWIQANHAIMQPLIVRRASEGTGVPYAVTLHGSDLNFSVKRAARLHPYMMEGLRGAKKVNAVSQFNAEDMRQYLSAMGEEPLQIDVIPAGVDTEGFRPLSRPVREVADELIAAIREAAAERPGGESAAVRREFVEAVAAATPESDLRALFDGKRLTYAADHPDADAAERLSAIDWEKDKVVVLVGKYLWTKGIQALLCAAPLVLRRVPEARFLCVGFGRSREMLQALAVAISRGDGPLLERLLREQPGVDAGQEAGVEPVCEEFLADLRSAGGTEAYLESAAASRMAERFQFTGIMSHRELALLLPLAGAFCCPSLFPEAFGMVSAEAMACGVMPVVTYSYGLKEIQDLLENEVPDVIRLERLALGPGFVERLAEDIVRVLLAPATAEPTFRMRLHELADRQFGWRSVAERYIVSMEESGKKEDIK